jgi:two-component system, LytTR family, sensor kinase
LLRSYVGIESERFRERLRVTWEIADDVLDAYVPELLLQPVVENALKHGLWPRARGGALHIRAEARDGMLEMTIEDDGIGLPPHWVDGAHDGTGLGVTRARLEATYAHGTRLHRFDVEPASSGGTRVTIGLPLPPAWP